MMSTTLQVKANLIKSINFEQFLNLISALSELSDPKLFIKDPKMCLQKTIDNVFLPLLS